MRCAPCTSSSRERVKASGRLDQHRGEHDENQQGVNDLQIHLHPHLPLTTAFRDRHARLCPGRHWVPARSELGARLATAPEHLVAVHDRRRPQRGRLVLPSDFTTTPFPRVEESVHS